MNLPSLVGIRNIQHSRPGSSRVDVFYDGITTGMLMKAALHMPAN